MAEADKTRENGIGVWEFDGGDRVWIAARSEEEARKHYSEHYEVYGDSEDEAPMVTEIDDLDAEEIIDVDKSTAKDEVYISFRNLIRDEGEFPVTVADENW